ncbi:branched-chain amino acid ABC transporter permease [Dehalogenimonas sp. THU2]|uniref:branched-chain amino acid ABC transporter permease n=1 Tax=Dehalogenimonas sp. THU2 TaxID=3151121 RepID=UPI0032181352
MNWAQILFNSAVTGSLYLISAVALTLVYGLARFPNFAHAEIMALGGFIGYFVAEQLGAPLPLAFVFAFAVSGLIGYLSYRGIFKPLADRGASLIHLMVASMALGFILRHSIGEIWGFSPLTFNIVWPAYDVGPLRISLNWLILIFTAVVVGVGLHLVLTKTKIGKAIRATASNPKLALSAGINTTRVLVITWFVSAGLAGIAGLFRGVETRLSPYLGWDILLPTFAVAVLGGIGSFYGAIVAAIIIGLAENIGVVLLSQAGLSTEYRMAIPFVILIVVLIFRPQGLAKAFKGN